MPKHWIAKSRLPEVEKKVATLLKRAARNKIEPFTFAVTGEEKLVKVKHNRDNVTNAAFDSLAKVYRENNKVFIGVPMIEIEISGSVPKFDNWEFFAKVEHMGRDAETREYINLIQVSPFLREDNEEALFPVIQSYDGCAPNCDHCNTVRRRNATFLVKNSETGDIKQVGGSCVDDFIGSGTLEQALFHYKIKDFTKELDMDYEPMGGSNFYFDSASALALSCYFVHKHGFAKSSEDNSTRNLVADHLMFRGDNLDKEAIKVMYDYATGESNKYVDDAKAVIDQIMAQPRNSEYIINAQNLLRAGYVDVSSGSGLGILASVPKKYYEDLAKGSLEYKEEFAFEPKQRGIMQLKVVEKHDKPFADYPYTNYTLMDSENRRFGLKSYYNSYTDLNLGDTYQMKATVKEHRTDDNGRKYTNINRLVDIKVVPDGTEVPDFTPPKKSRAKKKVVDSSLSM